MKFLISVGLLLALEADLAVLPLVEGADAGVKDTQVYVLPDFTELDDYHKCLSMKNAFYCFGTFHIKKDGSDAEYYNYIDGYSNISHNYNRTLIHRGYCMTSRCPLYSKTAQGFEECVQGENKGLNVVLKTLHTCEKEKKTTRLNALDWCFVSVILLILVLNIVGTIHGAKTKNFWRCWCVRSNWHELVQPFGDDDDTRALAPIQGLRIFFMMVIIFVHVVLEYAAGFVYDPSIVEQLLVSFQKIWLAKSVSAVQVFYVVSAFLTAHNLLRRKKQILDMGILKKQIIKRYFRSMAVDIQYQIISIVLTILLLKYYHIQKIKILTALLLFSYLFNTGIAYIFSLKPAHFLLDGKTIIGQRPDSPFIHYYYFSTWGSLPSCVLGLILAHIYYDWRQNGRKVADFKLLNILCRYSFPLLFLWIVLGQFTLQLESRLILAAYLGAERPVFSILACFGIFGLIAGADHRTFKRGPMKRFLSWRGWIPLGRLSLSVLLTHWVVINSLIFTQNRPIALSYANFIIDFFGIWCLSYILAVPVTVLVELPFINTHKYFTSAKTNKTVSTEPNKILNNQEDKTVKKLQ